MTDQFADMSVPGEHPLGAIMPLRHATITEFLSRIEFEKALRQVFRIAGSEVKGGLATDLAVNFGVRDDEGHPRGHCFYQRKAKGFGEGG